MVTKLITNLRLSIRVEYVVFGVTLFICGCRKANKPALFSATPTSFGQVFKSYWSQMNENYVYWDIDTTNWGRVYKRYMPLFNNLKLNSQADQKTSLRYFREITGGMIDSHYSITFNSSYLNGSNIYPALDRKVLRSTFHSPFIYTTKDTAYLNGGYSAGFYITKSNQRLLVLSGVIDSTILYFQSNSFALNEAFYSATQNTAKHTLQFFFDSLKRPKSKLKEIIIDLRNNSGGNLEDLSFLVGQFINKPLKFGYSRYKNGPGRLNFTSWIDAAVTPFSLSSAVSLSKIPIVILTDNYTISLAEAIAMSLHCLPYSRIVGDTTWGATGPITEHYLYNDGPFVVPGFLSVVTSSAEFKYIDGKSYEGKGFPPDIRIHVDPSILNAGRDQILETAIHLIE